MNKQHFQTLSQALDQLMSNCEDNETIVQKLIAEDSHRESSESTKRQSIDERVVCKRRQFKRKSNKKRVICKPVVEDIKPKHNKTSVKTNTKTREESDESYVEESDDSYVETKTYKAMKRHKPTKSGSKSSPSLLIPDFNERQKMFDLITNSYKCPKTECQKTLKTDSSFKLHLYRKHTNRIIKCGYKGCDKQYRNRGSL
ncbi:unnamed protein product [Medioppia subpectinata]|uniref:C2H2-type domain-containing protein n=1 Tax=Medioppia subpectinata TaxID=1979941 RepID=A0A7R9KRG2_9ACAR|nr:unnamed protein product [Medioppia subpectinata]CAG2107083.1 unnamed protein product [Medioppia subpectinata]